LRDFDVNGDSFRLTYNGVQSAPIIRGTNYTAAGIASAITGIAGFPAAATVSVRRWDGAGGAPTDIGFSVVFGGSLVNTDVAQLTLTSPAGTSGFVGETDQGGTTRNGGSVTLLGNRAPEVQTPAAFTIPTRTPFSLTGVGTDADGDTLVYLWEQNDPGSGTSLLSNTKSNGPLFRVFGTAALVSELDTLISPSPGQNAATTSPTRVFPDMAQIVAGNTNAATGSCPAVTLPVPAATLECYSEFLPTSGYANTLRFRLTARDTNPAGGGVAHADTTLTLAKTAGPFRVTSQASAASVASGAPLEVTWSVANTNIAPVSVANVKITLSIDGGQTFPTVLSASTPNDGSATVTLPSADTTTARIKVEAVGNVFFDVNLANFSILPGAPVAGNDAPPSGATAQYSDAPAQTVTISATDEDSPGSALVAQAGGLPAGLSLLAGTTSANSRTWVLGGRADAAPGTYPVQVTVTDEENRSGVTTFDVVVTGEDAAVTYAGDTLVTGAPGAGSAAATLRADVVDSSAVPGATDLTAGDVATATVTFKLGAATLCTAPVVPAADATSGTATCAAGLPTGATHRVDAVLGGRYTGTGAGDVQVIGVAGPAPPPPAPPGPAPPPPPPPAAPVLARAALAPSLSKVSSRLRLSRTGRVSIRVACRTIGLGAAPTRCDGTLRLTMRVGGKRRTVGSARFSLARGSTKTVSIRLSAKSRRTLERVAVATLRATVPNAGAATRSATKTVRIVPRGR
ncbi:MAG TPA: putative Ig domain-containing protein, partial [Solirubrobacteraceae bacterium]|nr:putative Ig domain-containing protein [Solirubrobacteraceae bacterium]